MDTPYAIEMLHITKRFPGIVANDDITLQLRKGEIHALLGENGAGKSTLMSVLFGLYQAEEGEIRKDGKVVSIKNPNDANSLGIGMVHQHFKLVECFTVLDNIIMGVEPTKHGFLQKGEARKKVLALSEKYGLQVDPDARIEDITVGMQQRVEILKVLYRGAETLILDEPTNHMDLAGKEALEKMLTSYEGTVLFVSHDRYFINQVATGILEFGESDVQFYEMNYAQYLEEIKRQTPGRETGNAGGAVRKPADVPTLDDVFDKKKYYNPGKILSRLKRQLEKYEEQLAESESRMSELQLEMMDPELSANYEQLMELQTKIDEENQTQESLLERMMETELELEEMETSESAFVRRQERY